MDNIKHFRDEEVFHFVSEFQEDLPSIMKICGWDNRKMASLLSISISSVNNYLGNSSMTNEKKSSMSDSQFIALLVYMQNKIIDQDYLSVAFGAFTYLCTGISKTEDEKLSLLMQNEKNKVPKDLIWSMFANWYPNVIRNINTFVDWQLNGKDKSLCEYKGVQHVIDLNSTSPVGEDEITLAKENAKEIIPLYLKMFISDKNI